MGLYNNVPTFTYVSATGITVTYNKEVYTVQSFYTNKKYIYWDYDNATVLQASNTMPTRSFKTHLVIINDNGIATTVPSTYEGFEISYGGDSDEAIKSRIYALYEKNKELGDKYVAIEQDLDGIKQIVGSGGSTDGSIIDRVSKIEQTAEDIKLSVNEIQKTYVDDNEMDQLREGLNSAIIELNSNLGTLNSEMSDYYKDNKITETEKVSIEEGIALINYSKSEVLNYVNKVVLICEESNQNENLISLNSGISALENSHQNLIQNITVAISDLVITPSEKTVIIDGFAKYNLRINELKNTCDDIILLGFGGIVAEKLSQITMNSNEIKLSISNTESKFTSDLSLQKLELKSQIEEVSSSLGTFKNTVETTFKDGVITEAEKKILSEKLEQLGKEKLDVDARYTDAYNNKYLTSPYNTILEAKHSEFNNKHSVLKNKILEVIELGNVTNNETLQVKTLFNEYSVTLSELKVTLDNSLDIITTNKANEEILKTKEELSKEISDVSSSIEDIVGDLDGFVSDGMVDISEKKSIEATLQTLEKEKTDIEAQYNYWSSNSYLIDPLRTEYEETYNNYVSKYEEIVAIIDGIIYKDELVSDLDKNNMSKAHTNLCNALYSFIDKTNEVIEFTTLKQYEDLISIVEEDIKDVYGRLGELDIVLDGTFENNLIDLTERKVLTQNITDLELQKTDIDVQYEYFYKSSYLDESLKDDFKNSYDNFIYEYDNLLNTIYFVIDKPTLINDKDRTDVSSAYSSFNAAINEFMLMCNEIIDYISQAQSDQLRERFEDEVNDLNDRVDDVLNDMHGAFKDNVLDEAERKILKEGLNDLEIQKEDVVLQYQNVYNDANLTDSTIKDNLKTSYDNFISSCNHLIDRINNSLSKSGILNDEDRELYEEAYNEYKVNVSLFTENFHKASDSISKKIVSNMKADLNKEVSELNDALGSLESTMNGIFKDGILSEAEKISIREQLATLEREKVDIDNNHNSVYNNSSLSSSVKTNLKTSYDTYVSSYNSLITIINSILNKSGIISTTEKTSYKNALVTYKGTLGAYTTKLRNAIDDITTNSINAAKTQLSKEISDVLGSLEDLETNMNDVFKDGVLSDAEKTTIKQQLETIKKEKGDVDNQYTTLYNNASLVDTTSAKPKSELKTAYNNFVTKYNSLVTIINNIVAKTTIVNNTDRTNLSTALSNYRTASSNYMTKATNAIDAIASKKATDESEKVNQKYAEILLSDDGIVNRVGSVEKQISTNAGNISSLTTRITTAESKITDSAIINTVSSTIDNKVNSAIKSAKSEIKQTTDSITQRVSSTESTVTTHTTQLGTVDSRINTAKNSAISTASSDATTKANNALADSKSYTNGQITTVNQTINNKVAEIKATTDSITQRVSSTESKVTTHTTQLGTVDSRINSAATNAISNAVGVKDTRNDNQPPSWYFTNYPKRTVEEFKYANKIGIGSSSVFGVLTTVVPWADSSGGFPTQTFRSNNTSTYERKGTSATAWGAWTQIENTSGSQAKATQALNDAKAYTTTQITTTNNKVASIETNLNGITSRVSNVETKQTTANNTIASLTTRMSSAESKITNSAIINTVSSTIDNKVKSAINTAKSEIKQTTDAIQSTVTNINNNYASKSQLTQTVNNFEFKFQNTNKPNELVNSDFSKGFANWGYETSGGGQIIHSNPGSFYGCPYTGGITLTGCSAFNASAWIGQHVVPLSSAADSYTFSGWAHSEDISYITGDGRHYPMANFYMEIKYKNGQVDYFNADIPPLLNANRSWKRVSTTYHRNKSFGEVEFFVCYIYMRNASGRLHMSQLQFEEGEYMSSWKPSSKQIYNNITTIDGSGIKVQHENNSFSKMDSKEFYQANESGNRTLSMRYGGTRYYKWANNLAYVGGTAVTRIGSNDEYGINMFGTGNSHFIDLGFASDVYGDTGATITPWIRLKHWENGIYINKPLRNRIEFVTGTRVLRSDNGSWGGVTFVPNNTYKYCIGGDQIMALGNITAYTANGDAYTTDSVFTITRDVNIRMNSYAHWNFNWWTMYNMNTATVLNAQSEYLRSRHKDINEVYGTKTTDNREIRCKGKNEFTCIGETIIEIPQIIAENIQDDYQVHISKYGFGDYYIKERNSYYFVIEADREFAFDWEVVATQIEKPQAYTVVASEPYKSDVCENPNNEQEDLELHSKYALMDDDEIEIELLKEKDELYKLYSKKVNN